MTHELAADFNQEVIAASHDQPVMVDFWAPWCGPCQALGPVLEGLAATAAGRWKLVKVNTESFPAVAEAYQIASIPAVKLFVDGVVVDEFNGALPESEIVRWLESYLPSPLKDALKQAHQLADAGKDQEALNQLEVVLSEAPDQEEALLLKAKLKFSNDPASIASTLDSIKSDSDHHQQATALKTLAAYRLQSQEPTEFPEGPARVSLQQGLEACGEGDYERALEQLIQSIETDRKYADEAAIKAGKAVFQWLGIRHPVADKFYRGFTSVLFS